MSATSLVRLSFFIILIVCPAWLIHDQQALTAFASQAREKEKAFAKRMSYKTLSQSLQVFLAILNGSLAKPIGVKVLNDLLVFICFDEQI